MVMGGTEVAMFVGLTLICLWVAYRMYLSYIVKDEGFESSVKEGYQFVMYYADWCGHCQRAKPEFKKLGSTMTIGEKVVKIVMVNPDTNPEAVAGKEIKGYPTIHLYGPKGGLAKEYSGQRTKEAFETFLNENVN
jgi:thiol-disulfide isomerase/thioredoxin